MFLACSLLPTLLQTVPSEPVVAASLFKNGYAMVTRAIQVKDGSTVTITPHEATLGTLWIGASQGVKVEEAVLTYVETEQKQSLGSLEAILANNVGKTLTLETRPQHNGQEAVLSGKLVDASGSVLVVETENGKTVALERGTVTRVVAGRDLVWSATTKARRPALRVKAQGSGTIYATGLQRGLTWVPAYRVELLDDERARLLAKATVMNDLVDFESVGLRLVTGFPNVKWLGVPDPLTSGAVGAYLDSLGRAQGAFGGGGVATQNVGRLRERADEMVFEPGGPEGSGQQLEDLFFYTMPKVSLRNGERLYRALFAAESKYAIVHTVTFDSQSRAFAAAQNRAAPPSLPDVWSTVEFKNTAGLPLTTGSAVTVRDGQVLGQDQIDYTSDGATVELKVTKALDVQASDSEELVERSRGAVSDRNGDPILDRITVKGTVELLNRKPKPVTVRVTKWAEGELAEAAEGGKGTPIPARPGDTNPALKVVWSVAVAPGERKRVEYRYTMLVPTRG